jgi:hypothetical protein
MSQLTLQAKCCLLHLSGMFRGFEMRSQGLLVITAHAVAALASANPEAIHITTRNPATKDSSMVRLIFSLVTISICSGISIAASDERAPRQNGRKNPCRWVFRYGQSFLLCGIGAQCLAWIFGPLTIFSSCLI